jgi:signal transduction histidine kinase
VREGTRAGEVVNRVRSLIRKMPPRHESLDLNAVILDVIAMMDSDLQRHRIKLETRLAHGLPRIPGDRVQLQ